MAKPGQEPTPPQFEADDLRKGGNRSGFAAQQLYSFVERLERIDEERQAAVDDAKEVRAEAKGVGFDTKIIGIVMRRRKLDAADRQEGDAMLELYEEAVREQEKQQAADSREEG